MNETALLLGVLLLAAGLILRIREKEPTGKRAKVMGILAFLGWILIQMGLTEALWPLLPQTEAWAWGLQIASLVITVGAAYWLLVPTWKK